MISFYRLSKYSAFLILLLILFSCKPEEKEKQLKIDGSSSVWYIQSEFDLANKLQMKTSNFGLAITRGRGEDVKGKSYIFSDGKWTPFDSFNYSDFPLITEYKEGIIWYVIHETHYGFYRPRMYQYNINTKEKIEIPLPTIYWDSVDLVMWKDIHVLNDGTAWMVGQLGYILYYDGSKWSEYESPVTKLQTKLPWTKDLNSIFMIDKNNGWAVGRNGIIAKFKNGKWSIYSKEKDVEYFDVIMIEDEGWIVGTNSEILKYENDEWKEFAVNNIYTLKGIAASSKNDVWFCGDRSTLLHYNGKEVLSVKDIEIFEDDFLEIELINDSDGESKMWVLGNDGVYSISQSFGFSFTKITSQAGLRREGIISIPIELNNDNYTDLIIIMENASPILYQNLGNGTFAEVALASAGVENSSVARHAAVGDINNDSHDDIFLLFNQNEYRVLLGNGKISFKDITEYSNLKLTEIQSNADTQAKFVDLNNDGNLDLYIAAGNNQDMIFSNDGTGKFTDVYSETKIIKEQNRLGFGTIFSDFNNDNLIDLFIGYRFPNGKEYFDFYLNKGDFVFEKRDNSELDLSTSILALSAVSLDYNNDGNMDIFVFSNSSSSFILQNDGKANFKVMSDEIGFDKQFLHPEPVNGVIAAQDVNNDGYVDLFIGSRLYINNKGKFENITPYIGLNFTGNPTFIDYDNDLDYDLLIGSSRTSLGAGDRFGIFRNNLIDKNAVSFSIYSDVSNRSSIGTKIELRDNKGDIQKREIGLGLNPMNGGYQRNQIFKKNNESEYKAEIQFPSGEKINLNLEEEQKNVIVYESDFINRFITQTVKSVERTLKLINPLYDAIKLFLFLFMFTIVFYLSKKTKAVRLTNTWYFPLVSFVLFILLFHFSINTSFFEELGITVLIPAILVVGFIYTTDSYIKKKESRFISHYKLIDVLGVGGMGKVFKAIDTTNKTLAAIKVINPSVIKDEENKKRLSSEGRLLASINHPNIVKVFQVSETEEHTFIAMEYLEGGTLHDYIEKKYPLTVSEFKEIVLQICSGLEFIHSKEIIHRDLKSQNIMFGADNNLRIMDFGLSKSTLVSTMTSLGTVIGTLGYVAPEQVISIDIDHRTDLFSLGVIMYQMLTKELPFKGENEIALIHSIFNTQPQKPSEINPLCTEEIDNIVLKALEKEPADRYNAVIEIKSELIRIN